MNNEQAKPKVLLVDDEEGVRISAQYMFSELCNMTTVENTAEALELLKKEKYDLLFLDMMIKGEGPESGLEMLKVINKEYKGLRVIILTGTISWTQRCEELKQLGAVGFLIKPFEIKEANELIKKHLFSE